MVSLIAIILAKYFFVIPVLVGGGYFLFHSRTIQKNMVVLSGVSLLLTLLGIFILQQFYDNPRPFVEDSFTPLVSHIPDNSFPSTHAAMTALIAAVMYVFSRKIGSLLFVVSILVSLARVYVGVHHFVDIVVGIALAVLAAALSSVILKNFFSRYFPE